MPVYRLHYFNARARGEGARWLLALGEVEFEDIRIEKDDWPVKKLEMPFGYVPVLEVDGERLSESKAICRYLANKLSLAGKTDWERAVADQYVDVFYDLLPIVRGITWTPDEQRRIDLKKTLYEKDGPRILGHLERRLEASKSGFFVGDSVTWADVVVASYLDSYIDRLGPQFEQMLEKFSKLRAHLDKVRALPKIAAFIAKSPKTTI